MRGQLARTVLRGGGHSDAISLPDLGLELTDPGFHFSVLTEFRARLVAGQADHLLLDTMLERFKARGKQRTDSTHVLGAVRDLHLLELVGENATSDPS
jgi:hypothetical protein